MANAEISFLVLFDFRAGGDQPKFVGPAQKEIIVGKFRAISQVGVPAFSRSDEQHAVSGVMDDVATIMKTKSEFLIRPRRLRKNDIQIVVASRAALLEIHALVLKKSQGSALLACDAVNGQSPGELERKNALCPAYCAQMHAGCGIQ